MSKFNFRTGRSVEFHKSTKREFNRKVRLPALDLGGNPTPAGVKLSRKAALGTVGITGGRRGMMAVMRESKLVVGA